MADCGSYFITKYMETKTTWKNEKMKNTKEKRKEKYKEKQIPKYKRNLTI